MPQLSETVSIEYESVDRLATTFQSSAETMRGIDQALAAAVRILETAAMLGLPGAAAMKYYLENIQRKLAAVADTCIEMSGDLKATITAFQEGDLSGSAKFNS